MSYVGLHLARKDQTPLSPPITEDEERWWVRVRSEFYRSVLLRVGLPMFLVCTVATAITKPDKLVRLPAFAAVCVAMSLIQARVNEKRQRTQEVRWKRIRETLLTDPVADDDAISPGQGDALS